jgi:hypothetical protein
MSDAKRLSLLGRRVPSVFERRFLVIEAGDARAYSHYEWDDTLVIIEAGEIELESTLGKRCRFGCGDLLWLQGLPLRVIHNCGAEPALVVAVSRCVDSQ